MKKICLFILCFLSASPALAEEISILSTISIDNIARQVAVQGNYAYVTYYDYVTDNDPILATIDISNPESPVLKSAYNTSGPVNGVTVSGNYAYVVEDRYGLEIIDISSPVNPVSVGSYYDSEICTHKVVVNGNNVYMTDCSFGLLIIDVTNPESPVLKNIFSISGGTLGLAVSENYVYLTYYYLDGGFLEIIDVSIPESPELISELNVSGFPIDVTVSGNYVYVANDDYTGDDINSLDIIDISVPGSPTLISTFDTSGSAYGVFVSGHYAYVANYDQGSDEIGGLQIIDVSNPTSPTLFAQTTDSELEKMGSVFVDENGNLYAVSNDFYVLWASGMDRDGNGIIDDDENSTSQSSSGGGGCQLSTHAVQSNISIPFFLLISTFFLFFTLSRIKTK